MLGNEKACCEIQDYVDYFKNWSSEIKPLAKLFRTNQYGYIYDTATGKVMQCEDLQYEILEGLLNCSIDEVINNLRKQYEEQRIVVAMEGIKDAIENENILKSIKVDNFYSPGHYEFLDRMINSELEQIMLELTERCNLRCGYCIYNDNYKQTRNHGSQDMTKEIARAAIDYAAVHGSTSKGLAVTFYGGEPLLKYDLLKDCIEYAQRIVKEKKLSFSLTTNLVLVTREIAKYLASVEDLSIVCSLDGPEDMHNDYRKDIHGNGSFQKAIQGLRYLIEEFGDNAADRMNLSMVFTPPYTFEKINRINDFFNKLDWLPKKVGKFVTYPTPGSIDDGMAGSEYKEKIGNIIMENTLGQWSEDEYFNKLSQNEDIDFFTKRGVEDLLTRIHKRGIYKDAIDRFPLNGCCVPGSRKIYVTTKGDFNLCERVSGAPSIGNVYTGIDFQRIKSTFVDEYSSAAREHCLSCWAINFCSVCYENCYTDNKLDMDKKNTECEYARYNILKKLVHYHRCIEENAQGLQYLDDIIIS